MSGFALLWGKILESSLWVKESKETRLVWITILAMKNMEGKVFSSVVGLADRAKVSPEECKVALSIFLAPDPDDTSKVEDGRRLREIPGGWQVINNELYRFSSEEKREFWRQQKQEQREKKSASKALAKSKKDLKAKGIGPLPGEAAYLKNVEELGREEADRIKDSQTGI